MLYKRWFKVINSIAPINVKQPVAKRFGPKTNFEICSLKFSAVVSTDNDVKLVAVPAHHPIKWACIKNAASHNDNSGPNKDKIGADVITGPLSSIKGLLNHPLTDIG